MSVKSFYEVLELLTGIMILANTYVCSTCSWLSPCSIRLWLNLF